MRVDRPPGALEATMRRYHATWRDSQGNRYEQGIELDGDRVHVVAELAAHKEWVHAEHDVAWYRVAPVRSIAVGRPEDAACEALTPGCCIDHSNDTHEGCDTW